MPSRSILAWKTRRLLALDELEAAHAAVGGAGPGRRTATQQLNQAYAVLLSSQFQGFCRDLHFEASEHLVSSLSPPQLRDVVRKQLVTGRKLDAGNPNPGNLGADFGRLGIELWPALHAFSARNVARRTALEALNTWRNAIAHQDFDPLRLGGRSTLGLEDVRRWRSACNGLAASLDAVVRAHLVSLVASPPWK